MGLMVGIVGNLILTSRVMKNEGTCTTIFKTDEKHDKDCVENWFHSGRKN